MREPSTTEHWLFQLRLLNRDQTYSKAVCLQSCIGQCHFYCRDHIRAFNLNLLPKEQFPRVTIDQIVAFAIWPGAGAEDIEDLVLRTMEEELEDVDGLKHSYGDAIDGKGLLTLEFVRGTEIESTRVEVERKISEMTFPEDVTEAGALQIKLNIPVIHLALTGNIQDIQTAEAIQSELMDFPGVSGVSIDGNAVRTIEIELNQEKLLAAGLSAQQVVASIKTSDAGIPAGEMDVGTQSAIIRTPRANVNIAKLSELLIKSNQPNAPPIRISDLGTVTEGGIHQKHRGSLMDNLVLC